MPTNRLKAALQKQWMRREDERWVYGTLGRKEADGSYTFTVTGRRNFVYVTIRNATGAQTVVPARNDAAVPHQPKLGVKMLLEKGSYVIHSRSSMTNEVNNPTTPSTGVFTHNHDDLYFRETEHLNVSAGAGDAGKPIVLNASGEVDTSMLPAGLDPVEDQILAASTDDTVVDADVFGYVTGTALVKTTWLNLKAVLKTYFDTLYGLLAGNNTWTGDNFFEDIVSIEQLTNNSGHALAVYRNKDAADTSGALVNFTQDHATDDQTALYVQQDGTGDILSLYDGATEVLEVRDGGGVTITQIGTTGAAFAVTRNLDSASTSGILAGFHQDNAGDDQDAVQIRQDGTGEILSLYDDVVKTFYVADGGDLSTLAKINLRNSSIAHGITGSYPTDVGGMVQLDSSTEGGLNISGITDVGTRTGLTLIGITGVTDPTDTVPGVQIRGEKKSGTGTVAMGAAETVLQVSSFATKMLTLLGSGYFGVNTTSPGGASDAMFTVRSNLLTHNSNTISYVVAINRYNSDTASWYLGTENSSAPFNAVLVANNSNMKFGADLSGTYTNMMTIIGQNGDANYGNVGIGVDAPLATLHVRQPTVGDEVLRLESVATNDDPVDQWYHARAATTNATITTAATVTIPSNTAVLITVHTVARQTGGSSGTTGHVSGGRSTAICRNISGTATVAGIMEDTLVGDLAADFTFTASGATIQLRVTGEANKNISWHLHYRVMPLAS